MPKEITGYESPFAIHPASYVKEKLYFYAAKRLNIDYDKLTNFFEEEIDLDDELAEKLSSFYDGKFLARLDDRYKRDRERIMKQKEKKFYKIMEDNKDVFERLKDK
ncbi:MAG: hypothetical protein GY756_02605 [bacterium]|nr:hypothetical protein [bacterium]